MFIPNPCTPQCQAEAGSEHGTHHDGHRCSQVSNAMTPQCQAEACTHDSLLKNNHSTMSGGGCHFIDHRLESPKHDVIVSAVDST